MSSAKPVITDAEPPNPAFFFNISNASSIPELIFYLKSTYREKDFSIVQEILMDRENKLRTELENLRRDYEKERDVIEKNQALSVLENMKMEEQLNYFRGKCERLSENSDIEKMKLMEEQMNYFRRKCERLSEIVAKSDLEKMKMEEQLNDFRRKCERLSESNVSKVDLENVKMEEQLNDFRRKCERLSEKVTKSDLEKMKMEEQLYYSRRKCEELSENVTKLEEEKHLSCKREKRAEERYQKITEELAKAQADKCKLTFEMYKRIDELEEEKSEADARVESLQQKLKELDDRMSRLKEKNTKKHGVDVSVMREIHEDFELEPSEGFEVNRQAFVGDCETAIHENLGSEVNLNSKNLDSSVNRAPRNWSACEVGGCIKNNLSAFSGSPGSSTVIHISDSDEEMACVSNSYRAAMDLTFSHQIKEEEMKDSSTSLSKRKRSLSNTENDDGSSFDKQNTRSSQELDRGEKQSFAHDNSRNTTVYIQRCDCKDGVSCHSRPSRRCDLCKLSGITDESSSDSDSDPCSDKNMDMLIKRRIEGRVCLSEDGLGQSIEKYPELCRNAVSATQRQQISPNKSSKDLSFTTSKGLSPSDKFSNLNAIKEEQFSPRAHMDCDAARNISDQSGGEGGGNTGLVSTKNTLANCPNAQILAHMTFACESAHVNSGGSNKGNENLSPEETEMSYRGRDEWFDSPPRKITKKVGKKGQSSGTNKVQVTHVFTPAIPALTLTHGFHTTPTSGCTFNPSSSSTPACDAPPYNPTPLLSSPPSSVTLPASVQQGTTTVTPIHESPNALVGGAAASSPSLEPGQVDASGKVYIIPDINNGFYPSIQPAHAIFDIIKAFYKDYYPTWSDITPSRRQMMFDEFKKHVWWSPENEIRIWKSFETRAKKKLSDLLCQARNMNERPQWIEEHIWNQLVLHWSSEDFKKKSAQAKANRASGKGGSYTGGSITFGTLLRQMEKELGRPPTEDEIFQRTRMKKKLRDGQKVRVDSHAEKAYDECKPILEHLRHTQSAEDSADAGTSQPISS